ncbi:MAG TPA: hypothetical protein VHO66_02260 [Ruminiclostridium sp.]|nr:hypothetical protein [Ruminiclostridium sp.]
MEFVHNPNLPDSDVALIAMSDTYPKLTDAVHKLGIDVIAVKPCSKLSKPVSSHADMLLHHLGEDQTVIAYGEEDLKNQLQRYGFRAVTSNICALNRYPEEILLNAARVGNKLFANCSALDKTIKDYCDKQGVQVIPVKQGYAKCSVAVVDESSIITADPSIANAANAAGLDVLGIAPGYVELKGYDYGFLGGTCGKISKDILAFTGSVRLHPDYKRIEAFCNSKKVKILPLTNSTLIDIGGIIPLKTRI